MFCVLCPLPPHGKQASSSSSWQIDPVWQAQSSCQAGPLGFRVVEGLHGLTQELIRWFKICSSQVIFD